MQDKLIGRQIAMFRCHITPAIGPKPKNAYVPDDMSAYAEMGQHGIYMKLANGEEHFVPYTNIETIRLKPQPKEDDVLTLKRKNNGPV